MIIICIASVTVGSAGLHLRRCIFQHFHKLLRCRTRRDKSKFAGGTKLGGAGDPFEGKEALQTDSEK